jgi:sarcosine oxidase subunit beta
MTARKRDVAIVGAGIIGLSCATFLAQRGLSVVVLERKTPGAGSSTRNGGGVRSQFGTATNIRLSLLSAPYWAEFEERFGVDVGLRRIGYLFLAREASTLAELSEQVELQHQLGVGSELLSAADVAGRWPSLARLELAGGSFCATDGFVNQFRVLRGLTRAAEEAGATIESGTDVTGMDVRGDRIEAVRTTRGTIGADVVVNCAGAWAPRLADHIGLALPIRSRRVQLLMARPTNALPAGLPWLIDAVGQVHVRPDLDGRAQVGGFLGRDETVDPDAFDHDADADWIAGILPRLSERLGIEIEPSSIVDSWAGVYPSTPDQHPILDRADGGMIVVGGFAGLGLMHAPAAGFLATELIVDGHISSIDPADVSLGRFSEPTRAVEQTGF